MKQKNLPGRSKWVTRFFFPIKELRFYFLIYFLYCCENELLEKFPGGQYFVGIEDGAVNGLPKAIGALTITNINSLGYWGKFTFNGQNAVGEAKEFTGTFKVVY